MFPKMPIKIQKYKDMNKEYNDSLKRTQQYFSTRMCRLRDEKPENKVR